MCTHTRRYIWLNPFRVVLCMCSGLTTRDCITCHGACPWDYGFSLCQQSLIACSSSSRGGVLGCFLHQSWCVNWYRHCCGHVYLTISFELSWVHIPLYTTDTVLQQRSWSSGPHSLLGPLFMTFPEQQSLAILTGGWAPHSQLFFHFWTTCELLSWSPAAARRSFFDEGVKAALTRGVWVSM